MFFSIFIFDTQVTREALWELCPMFVSFKKINFQCFYSLLWPLKPHFKGGHTSKTFWSELWSWSYRFWNSYFLVKLALNISVAKINKFWNYDPPKSGVSGPSKIQKLIFSNFELFWSQVHPKTCLCILMSY